MRDTSVQRSRYERFAVRGRRGNGMAHRRPAMCRAGDITFPPMFLVRIAVGLAIGYAVLVALGWLFQERLAFPAPRAPVPDPKRLGIANGERIEVVTQDGTR